MIVFYYNISNGSCRKAMSWFSEHGIVVDTKKVESISRTDLVTALCLSERGFTDLLKNRNISNSTLKNVITNILSMSFNDAVDFILDNPDVLKVPLIVGENKLVLGYNSEDMRVFISRSQRELRMLN